MKILGNEETLDGFIRSLLFGAQANGTYVTAAQAVIGSIMKYDVDAGTMMLKPGDSWASMSPLP